jgi:hypothetical protein
MRCTTQVCTIACGQTALAASGSPFSPSQIRKQTSLAPRLEISVSTWCHGAVPALLRRHPLVRELMAELANLVLQLDDHRVPEPAAFAGLCTGGHPVDG